jgi:nucleotide-binding universal stress UspA family protein
MRGQLMPKRTVLVPLDDSELSRTILPPVQGFFAPEGWDVVLFRAEPAPRGAASHDRRIVQAVVADEGGPAIPASGAAEGPEPVRAEPGWARLERGMREELHADVRSLARGGYTVTVAVHFGPDPARELIRFAGEAGVDLLAMATHGNTDLARRLDRSVASGVLRRLTIPILLMRAANGPGTPLGAGGTDARAPSAAPPRPATLAGLRGFGLLIVRRAPDGDIVEASGHWRPENRQPRLHRLKHALDTAAPVTFEGPISDPGSGGIEIDEATIQVYLTGIHHHSGGDGTAHVIARFVVPDVLSQPAGPEGPEQGTRTPRHG